MAKRPFIPIPPMAELPPAEEINVREILDKYISGEIDLICVLGPTASGKTRYAVQLAREINRILEGKIMSGASDVEQATSKRTPPTPSSWAPPPAARGVARFSHVACPTSESLQDDGMRDQCGEKSFSAAEIISADSRQVYRGMDIGTGKDLAEYEEIPYHLMDIVDAGTKYNIFEYQRDFERVYKDIVDRGAIPILCGGSGLYIEAATC